MDGWRRALPLLAWLGALASGLVLFHALGRGGMAPPPLTDPGAWGAWLDGREPAVAAVAVLRLVVLALAWYLVGVATVGIVARLVRRAGLIRVADALTVPMVRRLLQGALGVSLATAMVGASAPVARDIDAPRMSVAAEQPATTAVTARAAPPASEAGASGADGAPRLVVASEGSDAAGDAPTAQASTAPVSMRLIEQEDVATATPEDQLPGSERGEQPDAGQQSRHHVVTGESLWSIAQDTLAQRWEREPTDAEVLDYWQDVIDHNRAALADPDNPDLIFPGDVIVLPALPDRG